jgi:hypothetical protein
LQNSTDIASPDSYPILRDELLAANQECAKEERRSPRSQTTKDHHFGMTQAARKLDNQPR